MPGPADAQSVRDLEARIGMRLPGEVGESLLMHNGSDIVQLIPPNYCLHGVAGIEKMYSNANFPFLEDVHFLPIAHLGRTQMLVDARNGRIGKYDNEWGAYVWPQEEWASSFGALLEFVADSLEGPDRVADLGDDEWYADVEDEDFPGTLMWAD